MYLNEANDNTDALDELKPRSGPFRSISSPALSNGKWLN